MVLLVILSVLVTLLPGTRAINVSPGDDTLKNAVESAASHDVLYLTNDQYNLLNTG